MRHPESAPSSRYSIQHLIVELEVATGNQTVALSGIKFFFRQTRPREWKVLTDTRLRYGDALPEVITGTQVQQKPWSCKAWGGAGGASGTP